MAETRNTIRWDSVGADKVKRDYAEVTAANDKTASGFQKTGASASAASAGVDRLSRSTSAYASQANVAVASTEKFGAGLAAMGRTLIAYAAPAAVGAAIKGATDFAGRLLDSAAAAGISTKRYQELTFALTQSGVGIEQADQALATFNSKLGDAARGNKQLTEAFRLLGVNVEEVRKGQMSTQQALDLTVAALARVDNAAVRASMTSDVFGEKAGRKMSAALGQGTEEMVRLAKAAHDLGLVLDADMIQKGEAAGDQIEALSMMLETRFNKSILATVNAVAGLGGAFDKLTGGKESAQTFFNAVMDLAEQAANPLGHMLTIIERIRGFGGGESAPESGYTGKYGAGFVGQLGVPITVKDNARSQAAIDAENARIAETAAKNAAEWQGKIAEGWRDMYEKVGESSSDFYAQLAEDIQKAGKAEDDAQKKQRAAIEATIEDIQFETSMIGLSNDAREKAIALRQQEAAGASPDQMARTGAAIDAQQAKQAAQDAADEVKAVWDQARDDFSDSWSDLFYGIFNDGKFRFKDLADSFKSIWARTLADLLTMSIQDSFIKPMFDGLMGGAGSGTGSGGSRGVFGALGASLFAGRDSSAGAKPGSADYMRDIYKGAGIKSGAGEALGGAAMGAGIGSMIGGKASSILGAAGGAIGSMFGPIGKMIGSVIGSVVGLAFQTTPKSISSYGTGGVIDSMASGGLDEKIGRDMAKGVVRALKTFAEQLATGIESDSFLGIVGQRGKKFFFQAQETELKVAGKKKYGAEKFDTAEEAIAAAIEAAINSGVVKGLTDADKKLMRAATSVQEAMSDVVASHNFKRELDFQFIGLSSPLAEAQARLEFEYQQQLILAEKYEADKTKLEAVYAQKRLDLVEQYNSQQYAGLKSFLTSITAGSASPLSPTTRLGLAQANYSALSAKARSGDQDAIAALQGAAQDYLSAGKDVFASSSGFQSIYQQVVGDLSAITGVANPLGVGAAANQNVAAAVNDNTRAQAGWFTQAAAQRTATNAKLDTLNTNVSALVTALSRGMATPTQNGTVTVGTVDWSSISQAVGSLR